MWEGGREGGREGGKHTSSGPFSRHFAISFQQPFSKDVNNRLLQDVLSFHSLFHEPYKSNAISALSTCIDPPDMLHLSYRRKVTSPCDAALRGAVTRSGAIKTLKTSEVFGASSRPPAPLRHLHRSPPLDCCQNRATRPMWCTVLVPSRESTLRQQKLDSMPAAAPPCAARPPATRSDPDPRETQQQRSMLELPPLAAAPLAQKGGARRGGSTRARCGQEEHRGRGQR